MLASPCSLPSDQSYLQYHSRVDNCSFYGAGLPNLDSFNNNHASSNGYENYPDLEHGKPQRQTMHAIRALQFTDPNSDQCGKESETSEPASPGYLEDVNQHHGKNRKPQVHFEEKEKNGYCIKQKNGHVLASREEMMTAAKRLGAWLDECLNQLRNLEKECRKVRVISTALIFAFFLKRVGVPCLYKLLMDLRK